MTTNLDLGPNSIVYDTNMGCVDHSLLSTTNNLLLAIDQLVNYRNHYETSKKPNDYDKELWKQQIDVFQNLKNLEISIDDLYGHSFTNESVQEIHQD